MEKIIILGIGNQLMMDDGIGIYLVQQLRGQKTSMNIEYLVGESDIDYCLDQIEGATFLLIIDAVISGKNPGEITVYPLSALHWQPLNISPHNLHLFHFLYQKKETIKGYLIGVEPYKLSFHLGMSQHLKKKWNLIIGDVKRTIEGLITTFN